MYRYPKDISGTDEAIKTIRMRYRPEEVIENAIANINRSIFPGAFQTKEEKERQRSKASGINDTYFYTGLFTLETWKKYNQRIINA